VFTLLLTVCYVGICAWMYLQQRNLIYFPQHTRVSAASTDFEVRRPDAVLRGWVLNPGRKRALLYFGGNAEAIEHQREQLGPWFAQHSIYLLAYRGYGASEGDPDQTSLFNDALALFDAVSAEHISISVIGRSLGSSVATHVAAHRSAHQLVLITPFDSIARVAQSAYPMLPVSLLLHDRFETWRDAAQVRIPVLVLAASRDRIIDPARTEALIASFPQAPQVVQVDAADHNDIHQFSRFRDALRSFLHDRAAMDAGQRSVREPSTPRD
jgi:pimeloyl-ACP methyl ester carboxylesterase